jgi:hypothetical protein
MMKMILSAAALTSLLSVGCGPDKSKACEGCLDTQLRDCETAYEECDNQPHCRPGDIRREWADRACLEGE